MASIERVCLQVLWLNNNKLRRLNSLEVLGNEMIILMIRRRMVHHK